MTALSKQSVLMDSRYWCCDFPNFSAKTIGLQWNDLRVLCRTFLRSGSEIFTYVERSSNVPVK